MSNEETKLTEERAIKRLKELQNAVVLTREEYDALKKDAERYDPFWFCTFGGCEGVCKECWNTCEMSIFVKERNETVEKFARLVEFHSVSTRDNDGREMFTISALGLKEILHEEFGISYDEICKKFTDRAMKEEKTCKNISEMNAVDGFVCSECGISLVDYVEERVDEEYDVTYHEYNFKYCPNCGAKVVEE